MDDLSDFSAAEFDREARRRGYVPTKEAQAEAYALLDARFLIAKMMESSGSRPRRLERYVMDCSGSCQHRTGRANRKR